MSFFTSVEFFTIAFFVAMSLVGFFVNQKKTVPASSVINALELDVAPDENEESKLRLESHDDGVVTIERDGLLLSDGETVNLITTIIDDKVTISEKKGKVSAFGGKETVFNGHVDVTFFPVGIKSYLRYESSVAGRWCKLSFVNTPGNKVEKDLKY